MSIFLYSAGPSPVTPVGGKGIPCRITKYPSILAPSRRNLCR